LIQGYSLNNSRLQELKQSVQLIQKASELKDDYLSETKGIIQVLSDYALGLDKLDGYDHQSLEIKDVTTDSTYKIKYPEAIEAISE